MIRRLFLKTLYTITQMNNAIFFATAVPIRSDFDVRLPIDELVKDQVRFRRLQFSRKVLDLFVR